MKFEKIEKIAQTMKSPLLSPRFEEEVYSKLFRNSKVYRDSRMLKKAGIQSACSYRNRREAQKWAAYILSDKGMIDLKKVEKAVRKLEKTLYSGGGAFVEDIVRRKWIFRALKMLLADPELQQKVHNISVPHGNQVMQEFIIHSLDVLPEKTLQVYHVRLSVLSAWLTFLRQSVGSCFATAPAIMIQQEQPYSFFQDLNDLIQTGQMNRVILGREYGIPLSPSWGVGDLARLFPISPRLGKESTPVWVSPAFHKALIIFDLIEKNEKSRINKKQVKRIIKEGLDYCYHDMWPRNISSEELILACGLKKWGILLKEFKESLERKAQVSIERKAIVSVKSSHIRKFKKRLELAKSEYKNFVDHPLLKAWEYTIASFAESKSQFTRWNLYASLGVDPQEGGGVGSCIYKTISEAFEKTKEDLEYYQRECEVMQVQVQGAEVRLKRASSDQEVRSLKSLYQTRLAEMRSRERLRNETHQKASRLGGLFNELMEFYDSKFQEYFQEVYDAQMHDIKGSLYDDSPAGFRLLCKYGRANTGQWDLIYTPEEFINALSRFFRSTEFELQHQDHLKGLEEEMTQIITRLVTHIGTEEFLISSIHRMGRAHQVSIPKDPLKHLDKIDKKPWVYTSGGSMDTLLSIYFKREEPPKQSSRWVESPKELMAFMIDMMRRLPDHVKHLYEDDPDRGMLSHSPTHAFRILPGSELFKKAWQDEGYAYSWIQEVLITPGVIQASRLFLDREMIEFCIQNLTQFIPIEVRHLFKQGFGLLPAKLSLQDFREYVLKNSRFANSRSVIHPDELDGWIYTHFPLQPEYVFEKFIEEMATAVSFINEAEKEAMQRLYRILRGRNPLYPFITSQQLLSRFFSMICLVKKKVYHENNCYFELIKAARKKGYLFTEPFLFADSNWTKDYFAFLVSPATVELELWRVNYCTTQGGPMSMWKQWLDGSQKNPDWGFYDAPYQYVSS